MIDEGSPSSRRAWIEIAYFQAPRPRQLVALLAEGVDRNLWFKWGSTTVTTSPSSRRAWIEIGAHRRRG